jgi:hypothetical protein
LSPQPGTSRRSEKHVTISDELQVIEIEHADAQSQAEKLVQSALEDRNPFRKKTFTDEEDFIAFTKNYAQTNGFSIRLDKVTKSKETGEIKKRNIVCSKARTPAGKTTTTGERNREAETTGCRFAVRASFDPSTGRWHVLQSQLIHNHPLVPPLQRRFMKNERKFPEEVKAEILVLKRAGLPVPQIRSVLATKFSDRVTWIYDDIYNFLYQTKHADQEFDAQELLDTLSDLQRDYPDLTFRYEVEPVSKRLVNVIWMFPQQRLAYSRFSDVVVFDNTYSTNRFDMPFGIFTGVNNYGQSVCFAGSLLSSEKKESFMWLFDTFLEMVNNNSPGVLLTDDDKAISSAFQQTFALRETKHRLCLWHLLRNVMKNLLGVLDTRWSAFINDFYSCLKEMEEMSFLLRWESLKEDYPECVTYLDTMDNSKERWAPCYISDMFLADMTTTQRGESMNSLMKSYFDAKTPLKEFLEAFASALECRKEAELFAVYKENASNPTRTFTSPYEKQATTLLTRYAFKKIQEEIFLATSYKCIGVR